MSWGIRALPDDSLLERFELRRRDRHAQRSAGCDRPWRCCRCPSRGRLRMQTVCDDWAWLPPDRFILLRNPPFFFGCSASFLSLSFSSSFFSVEALGGRGWRRAAGESLRACVNRRDFGSRLGVPGDVFFVAGCDRGRAGELLLFDGFRDAIEARLRVRMRCEQAIRLRWRWCCARRAPSARR